jgi:benzaldehyde dehydrogenase (NAD)
MMFFDPSQWDGRLFSGGWTGGGGGTATVTSPATGKPLASVALGSPGDVRSAAERATAAQRAWARVSPEEKAAILRRAGALVEEHADVLTGWLMDEAGSAAGKAAFEVSLVASEFYAASALALAPYGQVLRSGKPRLSLARRTPVGTVAVISPFNFPAILSIRSVAPAIALGNAVILKPDPRTAVSGGLVLAALLEDAGLPDDVLQVIPGGSDVGIALVEDPGVRLISFTGSTAAGRAVGALAGRHLKRLHLELGGNSALIVLPDADVEAAASAGAWGSFLHQGQICMTTGRHFVHESLYPEYVERLSASAERIPVGEPSSGAPLGPVIDVNQRDRIHQLVTASVSAGARLAAGGRYEGLFYRPTVLADSAPDHPAFAEEVFGPVAPVMSYSTEEELIRVATASEYGLSLGILSRDPFAALTLAEKIPSGIVHINDQTVDDEAGAPFGGVGISGTGARFGGAEANIDAFTETQWVTVQGSIEQYPF